MSLGEEVRKQNIVEAIESFQGCLLLDPDNVRAKLYLAICLLDRAIGKVDEGRNYLSEVIASGAEATTVDQARDVFVTTYAGAEDAGVFELALEQGSAATDPIWRVAILNRGLAPMEKLRHQNLFYNDKAAELYEQLYLGEIAAFEKVPARQQFVFFDRSQAPFGQFESVTSNRADAERLLESFLPRAAQMYPGSAPCIWISYLIWRAKDTTPVPAPILKSVCESLEWCRAHPEKISQPVSFYRAYIPPALEWCAVNKEDALGEIAWDIREQAVAFDAKNNASHHHGMVQLRCFNCHALLRGFLQNAVAEMGGSVGNSGKGQLSRTNKTCRPMGPGEYPHREFHLGKTMS